MASTETADYKFTVKEDLPPLDGGEAPMWLMCEPVTRELSIVGDQGFLSLRLSAGITVDQADEIARYLQARVVGISYTRF